MWTNFGALQWILVYMPFLQNVCAWDRVGGVVCIHKGACPEILGKQSFVKLTDMVTFQTNTSSQGEFANDTN